MQFQQPFRHMHTVVRVDANQVAVVGRVVDFRQRQSILNRWLSQLLVAVFDDVSCVKETPLGESRNRALPTVGVQYNLTK